MIFVICDVADLLLRELVSEHHTVSNLESTLLCYRLMVTVNTASLSNCLVSNIVFFNYCLGSYFVTTFISG